MAMDALKNLVNKIPDWLKRLDDLSGQIDRRQAELAALNHEQRPSSTGSRSLRNKGSAESLKPKDDGPLHTDFDIAPLPGRAEHAQHAHEPVTVQAEQALPVSPERATRLALHKKARDAVVAAHSRALAQSKSRRRSTSIISAEGAPPTYRTRSLIIVYYDSYVQGFFDELVRFTSSGRNLLRKARMAAKVAQIKRMAELEMQDDDNGSGDDKTASDSLPSLRYMSTRRLGVMSAIRRPELGGAGDDQPPDIFECLDKSLEFVQSTCEHGAHQFLREADCNDEIKKIQARMTEVLKAAEKEMERVQREDPELAKETGDVGRARARRPISIRRELAVGLKGDAEPEKDPHATSEVSRADHNRNNVVEALNPPEVDTSEEPDEGIDVMLPKLQYRSTRYMRTRAG
ncbi:hypothetical protein HRG_004969 [Hirsutella rhossiliensis]|uniref:Uncharacterized protein n=1 Tax=Hirsutella rhossiliensis TaxID=111463 RepID=A0A9P8N260_9HYPO|nr:uncharacterized protein HRG_04969 [Hirsutella rhossiliensis]KAH0964541.1 hypothetical protein HRG_04969 [Hirsutella rhossiliensis]